MKLYRPLLSALAILFGFTRSMHAVEPDAKGFEFFEKKIRPVFVEHCYSCHSQAAKKEKKLKGRLYLDSAGGILTGGESGAIVVSGKPMASLLMKALRQDTELKMPPSDKLPAAVVADIETWIKMGVPMPPDRQGGNQKTSIDWEKARHFWAFQLPTKHPRPKVKDEEWSKTEVDYFVLAELEKRGLKPARPATRREWIRRATFDLIGLPPTPEEIQAFLKDDSPGAFAKVVDRLLASPHYGERWGRYWLDVVRYADDKALAIAKPSPFAFHYRDWVVSAFNRDMPYDRFLKLQIAGDLLPEPNTDPFTRLAGLGFQGLGAEYHKGNFAAQVMADELDDRVDTLSRGLLGLTVACARCHDHKYDPIPTRDYYSLAAAYQGASMSELAASPAEVVAKFAGWERETKNQEAAFAQWLGERAKQLGTVAMQNVGRYLLAVYRIRVLRERKIPHDIDTIAREEKLLAFFLIHLLKSMEPGSKAKLPKEIVPFQEAVEKAIRDAKPSGTSVPIPDDLRKLADGIQSVVRDALKNRTAPSFSSPKDKTNPKKLTRDPFLPFLWAAPQMPFFVDAKEVPNLLDKADRAVYEEKKAKLEQHKKSPPPAPTKIHGVSGGGQMMRVHIRGRVENLGEEAPPGFLRIFLRSAAAKGPFTRLELANAIATAQNPLTVRVFVNRVWQHHFGRGIVGTPSNFGKLGEPPTHPELLDTLALRFIESGWSTKWLHRELMLSAAYQLSSESIAGNAAKDPENQFLWRTTPARLDVEAWRDGLLAVSGRLDRTVGGPTLDLGSPKNVRRTLYATVSRSVPNATLTAFDFPDANVSNDRRSVTTVPQQQLFVLNSEFMIECAKAFAAKLEMATKEDSTRIDIAFQSAFGRSPTDAEKKLGLEFLHSASETQKQDKLTPWQQYAQALLGTNEFTWVD